MAGAVGMEARADRPAAHRDAGDQLPPLQPCADARTPLEALAPQRCDDVAAQADGDIFERLRKLQSESAQVQGPERHWGQQEVVARAAMEAFAHSEGEERKEAEAEAVEALGTATPTAIDADGFALIHYSAMYGSTEAIAVLLRRKAKVHARTKVHETPLQLAAYYRHAEACALLLAHRARSDLADAQGRTPLEAAKESKCGNGPDNTGGAQARCVALLAERAAQEAAWRRGEPPPPGSSPEIVALAASFAQGAREMAELKQQGNGFFAKSQHNEAVAAYSVALSFFDDCTLYSNRAECYLRLGRHLEAKLDAQKAVGLAGEEGHKKSTWRLGRACLELGELQQAADAAKAGLKIWPDDRVLRQLAVDVENTRRQRLRGQG